MAHRIQIRRGTAAEWTAANPTLAQGEAGYETDTKLHKVGDGATAWASLPYAIVKDVTAALATPTGGASGTVAAHLASKVSSAGGDASAVNITATGSTTARTAAALAADARRGRAQRQAQNAIRRLDLSRAVAPQASAVMSTPVPYYGTEMVHPDVLFAPAGLFGFRFWMGVTPYAGSDSQYENPSLYASHDGQTWVTPPGATNPVVPYPGAGQYNSDPDLVDGLDGRLYLFYRWQQAPNSAFKVLFTEDGGATWSSPAVTVDRGTLGGGSPAVIFDGTTWTMFFVDAAKAIVRMTAASPFGPWSAPAAVTIPAAPGVNREYWHLDAVDIGGRIVLLVLTTEVGTTGGNGDLHLAWSDDGTTYSVGATPVVARDVTTTSPFASAYRGSLVLLDDGVETRLAIWYSALGSLGWRLGYTEATLTASPALSVLADHDHHDARTLRAIAGIAPGVVGDDFARPDSALLLGSTPTGHAWTVQSGACGITGRQAYGPGAGGRAVVDPGLADGIVGVRFASVVSGQFFTFRSSDANNYYRAGYLSGAVVLQKIVGGAVSATLASVPYTPPVNSWWVVDLSGSSITFKVNERTIFAGTDAFNATATKHGIAGGSTTRYSRFYFQSAIAATMPATVGRVIVSASAPPTADAAMRGVVWCQLGGAGVKDAVTICAKDAGDVYAWRVIY